MVVLLQAPDLCSYKFPCCHLEQQVVVGRPISSQPARVITPNLPRFLTLHCKFSRTCAFTEETHWMRMLMSRFPHVRRRSYQVWDRGGLGAQPNLHSWLRRIARFSSAASRSTAQCLHSMPDGLQERIGPIRPPTPVTICAATSFMLFSGSVSNTSFAADKPMRTCSLRFGGN